MYPAAGYPYPSGTGRSGPMAADGYIAAIAVFPVLIDPDMPRAGRGRTVLDTGKARPYVDIYLGRCGQSDG